MARSATLSRSVALFRAFLREQSDPGLFYRTLAEDSVAQVAGRLSLDGATVLDVGAGPGWFADAFGAAGARYVGLDLDAEVLPPRGSPGAPVVRAAGEALPVRTGAVDVAFSSNVLEHASGPWALADELVRVTRPGGTIYLAFTPWFSPWGGHETAPWHYLGGHRARRRFRRRHGGEPKNRFGETLFPVTVSAALRWARSQPDATVVAAFPRYHPWWAAWVSAVPGLREVATWNLALVLRRR
jgi:SAM-dependent methyltransferase